MRVEVRLDGSLAVRFGQRYLAITACQPRPKAPAPPKARKPAAPRPKSQWMKNFYLTPPERAALSVIPPSSPSPGAKGMR